LQVLLFDNQKDRLVEAEIVKAAKSDLPLKKDGWRFNWKIAFGAKDSKTFILKLKGNSDATQGVLQLSEFEGVLIMNLVEIAPHNQGKNKHFEYVAGCLIAFGCNESFKLNTHYKGFLSFETKTKLRDWYRKKYYANDAMGNKMFIWPEDGVKLIKEFLERN